MTRGTSLPFDFPHETVTFVPVALGVNATVSSVVAFRKVDSTVYCSSGCQSTIVCWDTYLP